MIPNYTPPPPQPAPAEVQTINAAHAQRLNSPGQSVINSVNRGDYGKGFTARMPNQQQARDLNKSVEGIAQGVGKLGTAGRASETINAQSRAARGPGFTDRPTTNKGIEGMKAKTNGRQSAPRSTPQTSQNKGIASYQSKVSGQSSATAKSGASPVATASRGSSATSGKSGGASSGGKSGGGQSR